MKIALADKHPRPLNPHPNLLLPSLKRFSNKRLLLPNHHLLLQKKENGVKPKPQGDAPKGKTDAPAKPAAAQQARTQQQKPQAPIARDPNYESDKPARAPKDKRDGPRPPRRGRQNDRQSGTGRPANENKRSGAGPGNWGTTVDKQVVDDAIKETTGDEKEEVTATAEGETDAELQTEPEKRTKSLEEYREMLKEKAPKDVKQLKLRVAGEGVDQSAWAGFAPIKKDEEQAVSTKKKTAPKKETDGKEDKPKEEKVSIDKLFKVTIPPPQGVEERGQRGGRGGRGGKGPSRGGRTDRRPQSDKGKAFEHDPQSFPALGGGAASPASTSAASPAPAPAAAVPAPAAAPAPAAQQVPPAAVKA